MRSAEQQSKTEYIELHYDLAVPCWVTICHAQGLPAHDIQQCLIYLRGKKGRTPGKGNGHFTGEAKC
jgi:hypothetical protein